MSDFTKELIILLCLLLILLPVVYFGFKKMDEKLKEEKR